MNVVSSKNTVQTERGLSRNARLDRLPFNAAHRKLLVASGIGWAFDAMDVSDTIRFPWLIPRIRAIGPSSWVG